MPSIKPSYTQLNYSGIVLEVELTVKLVQEGEKEQREGEGERQKEKVRERERGTYQS